jgi:hypothetical protein
MNPNFSDGLSAAQRRAKRPESAKLPCYFYIDEAHTIIRNDARVATILDELRSQKVALIVAHQRLEQIKSKDVTASPFVDAATLRTRW